MIPFAMLRLGECRLCFELLNMQSVSTCKRIVQGFSFCQHPFCVNCNARQSGKKDSLWASMHPALKGSLTKPFSSTLGGRVVDQLLVKKVHDEIFDLARASRCGCVAGSFVNGHGLE